jgi:hypothetical protein
MPERATPQGTTKGERNVTSVVTRDISRENVQIGKGGTGDNPLGHSMKTRAARSSFTLRDPTKSP